MLPFAFSAFFSLSVSASFLPVLFPLPESSLAFVLQDASLRFLRLFFFICLCVLFTGAFSLARIVFCLRRFGGRRLALLLQDASLRFLRLFFFICLCVLF